MVNTDKQELTEESLVVPWTRQVNSTQVLHWGHNGAEDLDTILETP